MAIHMIDCRKEHIMKNIKKILTLTLTTAMLSGMFVTNASAISVQTVCDKIINGTITEAELEQAYAEGHIKTVNIGLKSTGHADLVLPEREVTATQTVAQTVAQTVSQAIAQTTAKAPAKAPSATPNSKTVSLYDFDIHATDMGPGDKVNALGQTYRYFPDVPDSHPNAQAINRAAALGLVQADANGNFNPDTVITESYAVQVLADFILPEGLDYHDTVTISGFNSNGIDQLKNDPRVTWFKTSEKAGNEYYTYYFDHDGVRAYNIIASGSVNHTRQFTADVAVSNSSDNRRHVLDILSEQPMNYDDLAEDIRLTGYHIKFNGNTALTWLNTLTLDRTILSSGTQASRTTTNIMSKAQVAAELQPVADSLPLTYYKTKLSSETYRNLVAIDETEKVTMAGFCEAMYRAGLLTDLVLNAEKTYDHATQDSIRLVLVDRDPTQVQDAYKYFSTRGCYTCSLTDDQIRSIPALRALCPQVG